MESKIIPFQYEGQQIMKDLYRLHCNENYERLKIDLVGNMIAINWVWG